jgi:hypothetical protein
VKQKTVNQADGRNKRFLRVRRREIKKKDESAIEVIFTVIATIQPLRGLRSIVFGKFIRATF